MTGATMGMVEYGSPPRAVVATSQNGRAPTSSVASFFQKNNLVVFLDYLLSKDCTDGDI